MGFSLDLFMIYNNKTQKVFNHETGTWFNVEYLINEASDKGKRQCFVLSPYFDGGLDLFPDNDVDASFNQDKNITTRMFSTVEINIDDPNRKRNMGISPGLFMLYDDKASIVFNPETRIWIDATYLVNEASDEIKLQCLMTNRLLDDPVFGDLFRNANGDASFIHKNSGDITTRMFHLVEEIDDGL